MSLNLSTFAASHQIVFNFYNSLQVDMCQVMHETVATEAENYLHETLRHVYVTPTSYLELMGVYSNLVRIKKEELQTAKSRLSIGLEKVNAYKSITCPVTT